MYPSRHLHTYEPDDKHATGKKNEREKERERGIEQRLTSGLRMKSSSESADG